MSSRVIKQYQCLVFLLLNKNKHKNKLCFFSYLICNTAQLIVNMKNDIIKALVNIDIVMLCYKGFIFNMSIEKIRILQKASCERQPRLDF